MTQQVDLNKLRETILRNQEQGKSLPARRDEKVYATQDGRIVTGDSVRPSEERQLSEVHQATFAAVTTSNGRRQSEQRIVNEKLPRNTRYLEVDGVGGWYYKFNDEFGNLYEMFAYHDGSSYQVKVVYPEVEGQYTPHNGHLFSDGRICFSGSGIVSTLEQAYAKSVLWANGFTVFQQGNPFPFSLNNQG